MLSRGMISFTSTGYQVEECSDELAYALRVIGAVLRAEIRRHRQYVSGRVYKVHGT